jgi:hypothetical protein
MRFKLKIAVAVAAATLLLGMSAMAVFAAVGGPQQGVALLVGSDLGTGFTGVYGDQITLQPASMSSIELPGQKFHFQVYVMDVDASGTPTAMAWKDTRDFEDIQLEDTNTVLPFTYGLGLDDGVLLTDGSYVSPVALLTTGTIGYTPLTPTTYGYLIRAEYRTADSSNTVNPTAPPSFSETEVVSVMPNDSTKVTFSTSGTVKHAGTTFVFHVSPASGGIGEDIGTIPCIIKVTVAKSGAKTLTYYVGTDETGLASAKLVLGSKTGTYKVSAKFIGNVFGVASATVSKNVKASH